jgi:hypothetical protein
MDPGAPPSDKKSFSALWAAFVVQVAGRLVDFWWHATHDEFETGGDQLTAHWLVWLGTLFILAVAVGALRSGLSDPERRGYLVVLSSNALYVVVAVIHFMQHLDRQEVDWAHISLAVTNIGSVAGVLMVTAARAKARTAASGAPR